MADQHSDRWDDCAAGAGRKWLLVAATGGAAQTLKVDMQAAGEVLSDVHCEKSMHHHVPLPHEGITDKLSGTDSTLDALTLADTHRAGRANRCLQIHQ